MQQTFRRIERRVACRRDAVLAHRDAARRRDLGRHLRRRQHAAVARLRALRELELDHLDLREMRFFGEARLAEDAGTLAGAEVTGAELPDDVAAVLAVIRRERTFAGVVVETA